MKTDAQKFHASETALWKRALRVSVLLIIALILVLSVMSLTGNLDQDMFKALQYKYGGGEKKAELDRHSNLLKPLNSYKKEIVKDKRAINSLGSANNIYPGSTLSAADLISSLGRGAPATERKTLVAASDPEGNALVVAGSNAQLYVFQKKGQDFQFKKVLWDGKTSRTPLSLAVTGNGRYAIMSVLAKNEIMTKEEEEAKNILNTQVRQSTSSKTQYRQLINIWDLDKEIKVQDGLLEGYIFIGFIPDPDIMKLDSVGESVFIQPEKVLRIINADLAGKTHEEQAVVERIRFKEAKETIIRAAASQKAKQIIAISNKGKLLSYKVIEPQGWWRLQKPPLLERVAANDFDDLEDNKPLLALADDGSFFVMTNRVELSAYTLPDLKVLGKVSLPVDFFINSPQLYVLNGTVFLAKGSGSPDQGDDSKLWSWKPSDTNLESHDLKCARYSQFLNSGHIATLGCKTNELRIVSLENPSQISKFTQPLKIN